MQRDDALLLDMLLSAEEAIEFASDLTLQRFEQERLHQLAILKAVETVGEAASQVSAEKQRALSDIPWAAIVGMRHRLVHDYSGVRLSLVWETVKRDLPALVESIRPLVPKDQD